MKINGAALVAFLFVVNMYGKFEKPVDPNKQLTGFIRLYNHLMRSRRLDDVDKYDQFVGLRRKVRGTPISFYDREGVFDDRYDELRNAIDRQIDDLRDGIQRSTQSDLKRLRNDAFRFSPGFDDLKSVLHDIDLYRQSNARQINIAGSKFVQAFAKLKDTMQAKVDDLTALKGRLTERLIDFRETFQRAAGNVQALAGLRDEIEAYIAAEDQQLLGASDVFDTHGLSELHRRVTRDVRALGGPLQEPRVRRRLDFGLPIQDAPSGSSE